MSHLSQNLEKLIQMISIEQLLGLVKQNTENKSSSDIMNLPIVQKVVQAYEDEIQTLHSPSVKDYSNDIAKIHEQLASINNNLLQLTEAIRNINITSNKSSNLVAEVKVESSNVVSKSEEVESSSVVVEEEHVRLKIEEKQDTKVEEESLEAEEEVTSEADEAEEESLEADEDISETEEVLSKAESLEAEEEEEVLSKAENLEEEEELVSASEAEDESEKEISDEELEAEAEEEVTSETVEAEVTSASETEAEEEDISETEEVFEIEIDDVTYYATSEENGILYEVDADGEVGKKVGIIKDGEPIFV